MSKPSQLPEAEHWNSVFRRKASVQARESGGETILVPFREGSAQLHNLFTLNAVGAFIWSHLNGSTDLASIHRSLVEHFEVTEDAARSDLLEYVELLWEARLIERLDSADRSGKA